MPVYGQVGSELPVLLVTCDWSTVMSKGSFFLDEDSMDFDLACKLLLTGDSSVGKSCLLFRFCSDYFESSFIPSIGKSDL